MGSKENPSIPNPYSNAGSLSKLLCFWIIPLFAKGYNKDLEQDDLFENLNSDQTKYMGDLLEVIWNAEQKRAKCLGTKPSLLRALLKLFWKSFLLVSLIFFVNQCIILCAQPIFLRLLIATFTNHDPEKWKAYTYAAVICTMSFLNTLFTQPSSFHIMYTGMKFRIATSALVYRKSLRLSKAAENQTNSGYIMNLLANDCTRFDRNFNFLPYMIVAPVQIIILVYLMYQEVGSISFAAVALVILLLPAQYCLGKYSAIFRLELAKRTDERSRLMTELICGIRVIKQYTWESPFFVLINNARMLELLQVRKRGMLRGLHHAVFSFAPKLIQYLIFLVIVLTEYVPLTADKVFFTLTCLNMLIQVTVQFTPFAAAGLGEILVAIKRIQDFLLLDELNTIDKLSDTGTALTKSNKFIGRGFKTSSVYMQNVNATWSNIDRCTLNGISLSIEGDTLVMVVGPVGSSKTSLLCSILNELAILTGSVQIQGSVSYASQEPWVFMGTLRQNILLGLPYEETRYNKTIKACALDQDFIQLPYGDKTLVGERGVALSGGQRARVNLARALYRKSKIYLLDDPLSAVDARVSRHIFEKCFKGYLKGSTRVLVTHQLHYLPQADHIIVMDQGQIVAQGKYQDLIDSGVKFISLSQVVTDGGEGAHLKRLSIAPEVREEHKKETPDKTRETKAGGSVNLKTYQDYFLSGHSVFGFLLLMAIFLLCQVAVSANDYWLSYWTNAETKKMELQSNSTYCKIHDYDKCYDFYLGQNIYLFVYSGITTTVILFCIWRGLWFYLYCETISVNVHSRMLRSIFQAPIKFFDENPSGRVMNRFTRDVSTMDELLTSAFIDTLVIFLQFFGVTAVVIASNLYMSLPTVALFFVLIILRRIFIRTARDIKRIESVTRSPIFTHVASTIHGLSTIRACQAENVMISQFESFQDVHTSAWFVFLGVNRCFGIWLELICNLFLVFVTFGFLIMSSSIEGGNIGLAISSLLTVMGIFQWGMRQSAETENHMTSVERALEYTKLETEFKTIDNTKPPLDWPGRGVVKFQNVSLSYENNEQVLNKLSFETRPAEKIGIVGRTGAGKSSIISALFRLHEFGGEILIDDIIIKDIGLRDLRRNISIIPQDPVMFSGTLRYNLDPCNQFEDDFLWSAVRDVKLDKTVESLDYQVADGGTNFSVGERQLLCLARAVFKKNRILVMDEATANVDPCTDKLIQRIIREKFANCTIITIAHRLHSIIDCDRILVLDQGHLMEYDHPHLLLQNDRGYFSKMVAQTGAGSANMLSKLALTAFITKNSTELHETAAA